MEGIGSRERLASASRRGLAAGKFFMVPGSEHRLVWWWSDRPKPDSYCQKARRTQSIGTTGKANQYLLFFHQSQESDSSRPHSLVKQKFGLRSTISSPIARAACRCVITESMAMRVYSSALYRASKKSEHPTRSVHHCGNLLRGIKYRGQGIFGTHKNYVICQAGPKFKKHLRINMKIRRSLHFRSYRYLVHVKWCL